MYLLRWDDGTGNIVRAVYETEAEANVQAARDVELHPERVESQVVEPESAPAEPPVEEPAPNPEG